MATFFEKVTSVIITNVSRGSRRSALMHDLRERSLDVHHVVPRKLGDLQHILTAIESLDMAGRAHAYQCSGHGCEHVCNMPTLMV